MSLGLTEPPQNRSPAAVPEFSAPYATPDEELAGTFVAAAQTYDDADRRIDAGATRLIEAARARGGGLGGIEDFLHEYSLSTKEGLALMVVAEALLRVPDPATQERLIEDKLASGDWTHHEVKSDAFLVSASAWALGVTARIVRPGESPVSIMEQMGRRLGLPTVRAATRQAMRLLGSHFVMGQTIEEALGRVSVAPDARYSFDMLGEGARTMADADAYFESYAAAIAAVGREAGDRPRPNRPGVSVKLSALDPHYEAVSREYVVPRLVPRLVELCRMARARDIDLTVDAEEADRLEISLEVVARAVANESLAGWDGFGIAVQAYQKRAPQVIDWFVAAAKALDRRFMVRLVKGAYWDTEVKNAQERGLADYPVFTRKAMTDLCYAVCARKLLAARPHVFPQFATHNALTVAGVIEEASGVEGYEFQRLHGMGQALYEALLQEWPRAACRIYAPVGGHRDLLAYLVRRLLENGANTSFVSAVADPDIPVSAIIKRPQDLIAERGPRHPHVPLPADIYVPERRNSAGIEFGDGTALQALVAAVDAEAKNASWQAAPVIDGTARPGSVRGIASPVDARVVGEVTEADVATAESAVRAAEAGFPAWSAKPVEARAAVLDRAADALEAARPRFVALLQQEGGKTLDDAVAEIREAVDFCRYYAAQARRALVPVTLPGPTGEDNRLLYRGRGPFVCISPWNFPLAIFVGQVAAALVAGNTVVAKPAPQTPLVAAEAVKLLHEAGVPASALHLVPGGGPVGAALVADPAVAGVAFTGSTQVAWRINRALAAKSGPIVPLIAETGGINAMIVDSTALPEQVTDDVVASAFRSAGQRCSALRLLCLQDEIADRVLTMIEGATRELRVGDPRDPATHVGPVIDVDAKDRLDGWVERMRRAGRLRFRGRDHDAPAGGCYVPPAIVSLDRAEDLTEEVFGPVLHVVRWRGDLDALLDSIAAGGYALTLGVHSRIDSTAAKVAARLPHGNVYVNRNMIGAVVGTQPFGGSGLSGTGPKAGGPNYLTRFAAEQVVTVNTAASGGNATLLAESDEGL